MVFKKIEKNSSKKQQIDIRRAQQKFKSESYVFTEEINKISLSSRGDMYMQLAKI